MPTDNTSTESASPTPVSTIIKYGTDYSLDVAAIPLISLVNLAQGGMSHKFGSEVASKVKSKADALAAGDATATPPVAGREATDAERAEWTKSARDELFAKLVAGIIGVRAAGGTSVKALNPVESAIHRIARAGVVATLTKLGLKVPKSNKDTVTVSGVVKTMPDMIAARIANPKFGPGIRTQAEREVKAAEAAAAKAASGVTEGATTDDLGV